MAGLFDNMFGNVRGGLLGGTTEEDPRLQALLGGGQYNMSNMLLGLGAGIAGGSTWGESVSGGIKGIAAARAADTQRSQLVAQAQTLMQMGASPQQALMAVTNPKFMEALTTAKLLPKSELSHHDGITRTYNPYDPNSLRTAAVDPQAKVVGDNLIEYLPQPGGARGGGFPPPPGAVPPGPAAPPVQPGFGGPGAFTAPGGGNAPAASPAGVVAGAFGAAVPPAEPPPVAPPVEPPVPLQPSNVRTVFQAPPKVGDIASMRKEVAAHPSIKKYQEAAPVFNSLVNSLHNSSRQADLDFLYGMATIFDPTSVVRTEEQVLINKTQDLPSSIVGMINRVNGGGQLQLGTRKELLKVAQSRVGEYGEQAKTDMERLSGTARRQRMNPDDVGFGLTPLKRWSDMPSLPKP